MGKQDDEWTIRRILVALDTSRHSLAALEAAAELAASMKAELQGLFVEDDNLLRAAGSPVAREVQFPFGAAAHMNQARMERQLRAQATQVRRALAAACDRRQVKWSFRVARGEVTAEVLAAALEVDLLSLGRASRPLVRRTRLGSTARAAAAQSPCDVLLLQHETNIKPPVVAAYDGSPAAQQALAMAVRLAQKNGGYLAVLILADTPDEARQLQTRALDWLRGPLSQAGLALRYRLLPAADVATLVQAVQAEQSGVLVLSGATLRPEALHALLDEVECPVLLVR